MVKKNSLLFTSYTKFSLKGIIDQMLGKDIKSPEEYTGWNLSNIGFDKVS